MDDMSPVAPAAWIKQTSGADGTIISLGGNWVGAATAGLFHETEAIAGRAGESITFDLTDVAVLDTAGAWLVYRTARRLQAQGYVVQTVGTSDDQELMLQQAVDHDVEMDIEPYEDRSFVHWLNELGAKVFRMFDRVFGFLNFFGMVLFAIGRAIVQPRRLRLAATVHQIEIVGVQALSLVGLITFLIGVVIAYQAASVLSDMNAEFMTVDMVTFITLRELGILLAAVMIVGRSGSSFTAQIGAMVMHEEVDAMRSLALDPIEILVVPRVLALLIIMPIMTFFADAVAMFGAILICWIDLGITPAAFIERAREVATGWDVGVGFVKAPVFGMIIALVGCYEGLNVTGSAESVGQQTTRSVVEAIFMILVLDAFFAVFFTAIGI
jgi:phospholipid/cholesterol/gamma-HCH transport system permease protein